ncbi:hypothetical protein AQJ30_27515 [Streptomyces longwoodensis]|uniref:Uncharacterized protein n=1 Tax=Streptomyces longwoodensis TaxID=68231 RepID=A0A101QRQ1_9ACTN|nr:hypothetical protein [Streptomyces longwoodensis]KUN34820.1 hypothetical protein AQJ30_27515 [Streptomyces longwoodensis]
MTTRVLATITQADIERHREALCEWARANGIEPRDIAAAPGLTVEQVGERTVIVYWEFQRSAGALWVRRAARLRVPLPALGDHSKDHPES